MGAAAALSLAGVGEKKQQPAWFATETVGKASQEREEGRI